MATPRNLVLGCYNALVQREEIPFEPNMDPESVAQVFVPYHTVFRQAEIEPQTCVQVILSTADAIMKHARMGNANTAWRRHNLFKYGDITNRDRHMIGNCPKAVLDMIMRGALVDMYLVLHCTRLETM